MKEIAITHGQVAFVDDEDFDFLMQWKWRAFFYGNHFRATRREWISGKDTLFYMHREILQAPVGSMVDHRDGNPLNNQRSNLRLCTNAENVRNSPKHKDNTSGYKGVSWHEKTQKWLAQIRYGDKRHYLGLFDSAVDAAFAYDIAAVEMHGEFARTNSSTASLRNGGRQ